MTDNQIFGISIPLFCIWIGICLKISDLINRPIISPIALLCLISLPLWGSLIIWG